MLHSQYLNTTNQLLECLNHPELDENVAVIVFGEETKFLHHYSNQYAAIKQSVGVYSFASLNETNISISHLIDCKPVFIRGDSISRFAIDNWLATIYYREQVLSTSILF